MLGFVWSDGWRGADHVTCHVQPTGISTDKIYLTVCYLTTQKPKRLKRSSCKKKNKRKRNQVASSSAQSGMPFTKWLNTTFASRAASQSGILAPHTAMTAAATGRCCLALWLDIEELWRREGSVSRERETYRELLNFFSSLFFCGERWLFVRLFLVTVVSFCSSLSLM